jgi:hypothetical protein
MDKKDKQISENSSRKKFIFLGLGAAAFFSVFKFMKPAKKKATVKMLTEDGKLVEIDQDLVSGKKRKITDAELKNWIKK